MVSQLWSKVGKVVGGLLLASGGTVSVGFLVGIAAGQPSGIVLTLLILMLVFFGLVPTSIGGLLLYSGTLAERQALRDRFFQLLQMNRGRLSLIDFATATRLEPAIARHYLDGWAKEFSAEFEVSEAGEIYYLFSNEVVALPPANPRLQALGQFVREVARSL